MPIRSSALLFTMLLAGCTWLTQKNPQLEGQSNGLTGLVAGAIADTLIEGLSPSCTDTGACQEDPNGQLCKEYRQCLQAEIDGSKTGLAAGPMRGGRRRGKVAAITPEGEACDTDTSCPHTMFKPGTRTVKVWVEPRILGSGGTYGRCWQQVTAICAACDQPVGSPPTPASVEEIKKLSQIMFPGDIWNEIFMAMVNQGGCWDEPWVPAFQ